MEGKEQAHDWLRRLAAAGVSVRAVAWLNMPQWGTPDWQDKLPAAYPLLPQLDALWQQHGQRVSEAQPVCLERVGADMLLSCLVASAGETKMVLGCLIAPPFDERTAQIVQLGLGWLYYQMEGWHRSDEGRSARLLELLGYVLSQPERHQAAQEWVNRTAVWAQEAHGMVGAFSLLWFELQGVGQHPKLLVMSNVAWIEKGSPALESALELAARCAVGAVELAEEGRWALPLLHGGEVRAVLVAYQDKGSGLSAGFEPESLRVMRACASVVEPVLRLWRQGERSLWAHSQAVVAEGWAKLVRPGYLVWKASTALAVIFLAVVLLVPVNDVVTAHLYIEGGSRRVLTAPQDGYLAEVLVRPGDKVLEGQLLARLEDKDLKLQEAELLSEAAQADSRFREAMAAGDAAQSGIAANQRQQAQVRLDLIRTRLNRVAIRAPMAGSVVSGDWVQQIGAPLEEGKELFQIADTAQYRAVLHVPDKDMDEVAVGQTGYLKLASLPDEKIRLEVSRLTAVATVQDGVNGFYVEARLQQVPPRLSPGMQGIGKLVVGKTNLLMLWSKNFRDWLRLKLWSWW